MCLLDPPIMTAVVRRELCCGCGVCAGVCPSSCLAMEFDRYGELKPVVTTARCVGCGKCVKVCPFHPANPGEAELGQAGFELCPGMKHHPDAGFFLSSRYAHVIDDTARWASASGGIATWLLTTLLSRGEVDGVICVIPTGNPDKLFTFTLATSVAEIKTAAKSAYYPVEVGGMVDFIRQHPGRYVMVGLPCVLKAIELARRCDPILRERIRFLLGLVCGQQKSRHYTGYLAAKAGCSAPPRSVCFRGKIQGQPSSNFAFTCQDQHSQAGSPVPFTEIHAEWAHDWFKVHACNMCGDVFAECADMCVMDAWLPRYQSDARGGNLLLVRNPLIEEILKDPATSGELALEPVSIEDVLASQSGVIFNKRVGSLMNRHRMAGRLGAAAVPPRREVQCRPEMSPVRRGGAYMVFRLKYRANRVTRNARNHSIPPAAFMELRFIGFLINLIGALLRRCR